MNHKYVSIDRIFAKVARDLGADTIKEGDLVEWTGEALEFIGATKLYEEAVAFIEVNNHQIELPVGLHAVIQIARNTKFTKAIENNPFCPAKVVEALTVTSSPFLQVDEDCIGCTPEGTLVKPDYVLLDCNGMPIDDYDIAYYRPYFDLKAYYFGWKQSSMYRNNFTPVRLKTSTFFNSLVCKENDFDTIYQGASDEYTIVQGKMVRFSFKEGQVAVAYLRQITDPETGYPMIPDNISYTTAIVKYITMMINGKQFQAGRDGSKGRLDKAEMDWQWYCSQASNIEKMPYGVDEYQNLLDQRNYLLPRQNAYYSFFGNLGKPENRKYNNPDRLRTF